MIFLKQKGQTAITIATDESDHQVTLSYPEMPFCGDLVTDTERSAFCLYRTWCGIADAVDATGQLAEKNLASISYRLTNYLKTQYMISVK